MVEQGLRVTRQRVVGVVRGFVWLRREPVAAVVEGDGAEVVVDEGVSQSARRGDPGKMVFSNPTRSMIVAGIAALLTG